jgi:hypothetical protein
MCRLAGLYVDGPVVMTFSREPLPPPHPPDPTINGLPPEYSHYIGPFYGLFPSG